MKELKPLFDQIKLAAEPYTHVHFSQRTAYRCCLVACFSKAVEFGHVLFHQSGDEQAYFHTASLRGVCEEIIVLLYLQQKLRPHQNKVIMALVMINMRKDLLAQEAFFRDSHPYQPVLDAKLIADDTIHKLRIKTILQVMGIKGDTLPPVEQMANTVGLSGVYNYLYRATSNFVHFNPGNLLRMGWGDQPRKFHFSPANFYRYYARFNQFYVSYLLVVFCTVFRRRLPLKPDIWKLVQTLNSELDRYLTWPELVTFEEMNIKRPSEILTVLSQSISEVLQKAKKKKSAAK